MKKHFLNNAAENGSQGGSCLIKLYTFINKYNSGEYFLGVKIKTTLFVSETRLG